MLREAGREMLSSATHERIRQAVADAKTATRSEIVCTVIDEAAAYAEVPLAWAAIGALLLPFVALTAVNAVGHFDFALGDWSVAQLSAMHATVLTALTSYALLQGILFLSIFAFVSIPSIRRHLTPSSLKRARVRQRAIEQFLTRGLDKAQDQTGLLVFVSLKDRRAEILANSAISNKVGTSAWEEVISALAAGAKSPETGDGFVAAIEHCGRLLAEHFPAMQEKSPASSSM